MVVWESVPTALMIGGRGEDDAREIFEIDLVADAHPRGDGGEIAEGGLAPLQEGVALVIALEFEERVGGVGAGGSELIHLDGVINDELGGLEGIDAGGISAQLLHGIAHGGEVNDGGDAGEVLHEDAGGHVLNFAGGLGGGVPLGEELDVGGGDGTAVFVAEEIFKKDFEGVGKAGDVEAAESEGGQGKVFVT
jgi:hypothetical protein